MGFVVRQRERLPCRPGRGIFPNQPSLTDSLPPRKKGRPESAGQKKSQQTKKKQIKSTIIKHRCYKENKLHKIYWFLTKLDICGKDIRSSSQVRPGRAHVPAASPSPPPSSPQPTAGGPAATPPALHGRVTRHYPCTFVIAMSSYWWLQFLFMIILFTIIVKPIKYS